MHVKALPGDPTEHVHAVRFYENTTSLCRTVADFLSGGFGLGQPALVIATPAHTDGVVEELRARSVDVDALADAGALVLLDARKVLTTFMQDGVPDAERFRANITEAIDRLNSGREECTIRAYGEMVDVLWQDGLTSAAIRLEMLWNQLALSRNFSLLCGYAIRSFYKDAGMREICAQHSYVIPANAVI
jgi:hypothetical protein